MTRYVNTVYTFVLPANTSSLPRELWNVSLLITLDQHIKHGEAQGDSYPHICPYPVHASYIDTVKSLAEQKQEKEHLYCALMDLISDDVLQPLTLYRPHQKCVPVTAYRIIECPVNDWTWVKLYVRTQQE